MGAVGRPVHILPSSLSFSDNLSLTMRGLVSWSAAPRKERALQHEARQWMRDMRALLGENDSAKGEHWFICNNSLFS
jgi:hypothetical protein